MDDLISRQAAIIAIGEYYADKKCFRKGRSVLTAVCLDMQGLMEGLPAIQPKRGKWIPHREVSREYIGTVLVSVEYDYWLCSSCGYRVENGQPLYNFCPSCGAQMEKGEDDD